MNTKQLPLSEEQLKSIVKENPTPFHLYDEEAIRQTARDFSAAFSWVPGGFKNFYAVKALPNPYILQILKEEGMGTDCSSLPELVLSEKAGITGEEVIMTSNDTPPEEFEKAAEMGAIINLDDISHLDYMEKTLGRVPQLICFRYNPGSLKEGNTIIGHPEEAKYGFTREQLFEGYRRARDKGVKRFGIHTMVASNELNPDYFIETAQLIFQVVADISRELGITFEFANLGGGIGIPYKLEDSPVDLNYVSRGVQKAYREHIEENSLAPLRIVMECGRMVTGPHGYLVTQVRHIKKTYKTFVGVDACMADLMRPGMYGAYHHITVPGKEADKKAESVICDVTGSLCENIDKFAIDRKIPAVEPGDLLVIHDTGAHGYAMGFNYNAKLRHAEILFKRDGSARRIRRPETMEDYFATLDFSGLP